MNTNYQIQYSYVAISPPNVRMVFCHQVLTKSEMLKAHINSNKYHATEINYIIVTRCYYCVRCTGMCWRLTDIKPTHVTPKLVKPRPDLAENSAYTESVDIMERRHISHSMIRSSERH